MKSLDEIPGYLRPDVRTRLTQLITVHDVESVIEIGSFVGQSAVFFAQRVDHVLCIDPFDLDQGDKPTMGHKRHYYANAGFETQYETFLDNVAGYDNIRHIVTTSEKAVTIPSLRADLIFIDGDHRYEAVVHDIVNWRPRANKVLCGDDNDHRWGVAQAVIDLEIPNRKERIWWEER